MRDVIENSEKTNKKRQTTLRSNVILPLESTPCLGQQQQQNGAAVMATLPDALYQRFRCLLRTQRSVACEFDAAACSLSCTIMRFHVKQALSCQF